MLFCGVGDVGGVGVVGVVVVVVFAVVVVCVSSRCVGVVKVVLVVFLVVAVCLVVIVMVVVVVCLVVVVVFGAVLSCLCGRLVSLLPLLLHLDVGCSLFHLASCHVLSLCFGGAPGCRCCFFFMLMLVCAFRLLSPLVWLFFLVFVVCFSFLLLSLFRCRC